MKTAPFLAKVLLLICLARFGYVSPALADPLLITNNSPSILLSALQSTNNGGHIILDFDGTVTLGQTLLITNTIVIEGQTNRNVSISGSNKVGIIKVAPTGILTLWNINLINGRSTAGAGIYNDGGTVMLVGCALNNNTATNKHGINGTIGTDSHPDGGNGSAGSPAYGGAIYTTGPLRVFSCIFSNNSAFGGDGGSGGSGCTNSSTFGGNGGNAAGGGNGSGGAIYVAAGTDVSIAWSAFFGNFAFGGYGGIPGAGGPGIYPGDAGEAAYAGTGTGGAIYNAGGITLTNSLFGGNGVYGGSVASAGVYGAGGSRNGLPGASAWGGAIQNIGVIGVTNCTFGWNYSEGGAGGNVLVSSAIATAGSGGNAYGGALSSTGTASAADLVNCTFYTNALFGGTNGVSVTANRSGSMGSRFGASIYHDKGTLTLRNSILDSPANSQNVSGTITDGGYNLCSDKSAKFTASGSINNIQVALDTDLTMSTNRPSISTPFEPFFFGAVLPLPNSPAIDAIPVGADYPGIDQRGFARPQGHAADIGAVELEPARLKPSLASFTVNATRKWSTNITVEVPATVLNATNSWKTNIVLKTGDNATLTVVAGGQKPIFYQWSVDGYTISGATTPSLSITGAHPSESGVYTIAMTNALGQMESTNISLGIEILDPVSTGLITATDPATLLPYGDTSSGRLDAVLGDAVSLTAPDIGSDPRSYRWFFNNINLTNETEQTLTIDELSETYAGNYSVVVSNAVSMATNKITVVIHKPASIAVQPADRKVMIGSDVVLSALVQGDPPIYYTWTWNDQISATTTNPTFRIRNVQTPTNTYSLSVSNQYNSASYNRTADVSSVAQVILFRSLIITAQPQDTFAKYGDNATISVTADSTAGNLTYQWLANGVVIPDQTNNVLTISDVHADAVYTVVVADEVSRVTSAAAKLTVGLPPSITRQPTSQLLTNSQPSSLVVAATGASAFQWLLNGAPINGATSSVYSIAAAQSTNAGTYAVRVTGTNGSVMSSNAILAFPVRITTPLLDQTVASGRTNFTLSVQAEGTPTAYQWFRNNSLIFGRTNSTLVFGTVAKTDAGQYKVVASNPLSSASSSANISVQVAPLIISQLRGVTNVAGSKLSISASAQGDAPMSYRWWLNSTNTVTTPTPSLTIPKVTIFDAGVYSLVASNSVAIASNTIANVIVLPPAPVITTPSAKPVAQRSVALAGAVDPFAGVTNVVIRYANVTTNIPVNSASWSASLQLNYGTNLLTVTAKNRFGESAPAKARFVVAVPSLFKLNTIGKGTVSPNLNGKYLNLGQTYTLTAKPGAGSILANWTDPTGAALSSPVLVFTMQSNLTITATFTNDPYSSIKGSFTGTFADNPGGTPANAGAISFTIKDKGIYTGKIWRGTNILAISGQFDSQLVSFIAEPWVALDSLQNSNQLSGTISHSLWGNSSFRVVRTGVKQPSFVAGKYNIAMTNNNGVASMTVDKTGKASLSGFVGDGTSFTASGTISYGGQLPLFAPIRDGLGSVSGWLTFSTNDLTGHFLWLSSGKSAVSSDVVTSRYPSVTGNSPLLPWSNGTFFTDDLEIQSVGFSNNTFVVSEPDINLVLKLNKTNGVVTGSFRQLDAIATIYGVILTNQNQVQGFYLGTNGVGSLLIKEQEQP